MSYMNGISMLDTMPNDSSHDVPSSEGDLNKKEPGKTQQRRESDSDGDDSPVEAETTKSSIADELPPNL